MGVRRTPDQGPVPVSETILPEIGCKGLTLLEVMISVFVMVIIMGVLYGAYQSSVESVQIARDGGEIRQIARLILDRMSLELECALAGDGLSLVGEDAEMDGRPADRLFFHSAGGSRKAGVDLVRVSYNLVADPQEDSLTLTRTEEGVIGLGGGVARRTDEIAGMIRGLDISYYDPEGQRYEGWNTGSGGSSSDLPSFILIRLVLRGTAGETEVFTTGVHPELAP